MTIPVENPPPSEAGPAMSGPAGDNGHATPPAAAAMRHTRRLTIAYIAALAVVALLSGATHLLLNQVIMQQRDSGTLVNVAGRQRMLSQRIALLASDLRADDAEALPPLREAIRQMARAHMALVERDDLGLSTPLSATARARYFDGDNPLDARVRAFLDAARMVAEAPRAADSAAALILVRRAAQTDLLPDLEGMVQLYEAESRQRIDRLQTAQQVVLIIILGTLALEAVLIFRPLLARMRGYADRLYDVATRDTLTGLPNRRFFRETAERALLQAGRQYQTAAVLLVDIDRFRLVNESQGQAAGDAVLQQVGLLLQDGLRRSDVVGRLGGGEFAALLPGLDRATALTLAEKLRSRIEAADAGSGKRAGVTVSIGLAMAGPDSQAGLDPLLAVADAALYAAKSGGGNRVLAG